MVNHGALASYSVWGSNPRPMAHKTIALTTELTELLPGAFRAVSAALIGPGAPDYAPGPSLAVSAATAGQVCRRGTLE